MIRASRVIIGANGSPGSLRALRQAREVAEHDDAMLDPVVAWTPPGGDLACRPDDLLVIGAGRRGPLGRIRGGQVSRYCLAHATCLVLAVPPPALAEDMGPALSTPCSGTVR